MEEVESSCIRVRIYETTIVFKMGNCYYFFSMTLKPEKLLIGAHTSAAGGVQNALYDIFLFGVRPSSVILKSRVLHAFDVRSILCFCLFVCFCFCCLGEGGRGKGGRSKQHCSRTCVFFAI